MPISSELFYSFNRMIINRIKLSRMKLSRIAFGTVQNICQTEITEILGITCHNY
jgi:hypothetical protein